MKIVHVVESMRRGGAESVVVEHVRHAGPGFETAVVALNDGGPALEEARAAGARAYHIGKHGARLDGITRLAAILREEHPDVVNGHNATGGLYAVMAARLAGIPVVFRTEHTLHFPARHSVVYPFLEPLATALTRRVVCVCQAVLESHVSRLPWAARRFVTVANGISPAPHTRPREDVRHELGMGEADTLVLSVGSLTPQKAQDVLIDAFAVAAPRSPSARLVIAGEGPLRGALESRIATLGLAERVRLLGDRSDAADLMAAADLFVLSSRREGLPMTLIEAMRAGCAAVSTRIGGTGEAIEDGVTGRLVGVGDVAALGDVIATLLDDHATRRAYGTAGRARFHARFTAERMVRETEALYREVGGVSAWRAGSAA
ncbi:MAG: glycosyltransferase [Candidatus Eisenbacteria bacterium]